MLAAKGKFNTQWKEFCLSLLRIGKRSPPRSDAEVERWRDIEIEKRLKFVARFVDSLESIEQEERVRALEVLSYIAQGRSVRGLLVGGGDSNQKKLYVDTEAASQVSLERLLLSTTSYTGWSRIRNFYGNVLS